MKDKYIIVEIKNTNQDFSSLEKHKVITTADGKHYLVVPRTIDYAIELKRLGLTNTIITKNFKYSGPFSPKKHQYITVEAFISHRKIYCLNDMGTGKTACCIWAAEFLRAIGKIKKVLVISTKTCLRTVWADEIFKLYPYRTVEVAHSNLVEDRVAAISMDPEYLIINPDGIKLVLKELLEYCPDVVVIDECTAYKHTSSDRHKALTTLLEVCKPKYIWPLTGTPVSTSPADVHGYIRLVHPERMTMSYQEFKELVMIKVAQFKWVPRTNALDIVYSYMVPAVRFSKRDCVDMPPITYIHRRTTLTKEQEKAFKDMKERMRIERAADKEIKAINAATMLSKLVQICMGAVYDNDGKPHYINSSNRLNELHSIIEEANDKTLILVPFRSIIPLIAKFLEQKGRKPAIITGDTSVNERKNTFTEFQKGDRVTDIIAHPMPVAHGITLTESHTTIWYGPITSISPEYYTQANNRMDRPGQVNPVNIIHMSACDFEDTLYKALADKENFQNNLFDVYEELTSTL